MDERADKVSVTVVCQGKTLSIGTSVEPDHDDFLKQWKEIGEGIVTAWARQKRFPYPFLPGEPQFDWVKYQADVTAQIKASAKLPRFTETR